MTYLDNRHTIVASATCGCEASTSGSVSSHIYRNVFENAYMGAADVMLNELAHILSLQEWKHKRHSYDVHIDGEMAQTGFVYDNREPVHTPDYNDSGNKFLDRLV